MNLRHSAAVAKNDSRMLRRDPVILVIFTVMPIAVMAFVKPAFRAALTESGNVGANGAEQAVPGMAVMFAFFLVSNFGLYVLSEHSWRTWERLLASGASAQEVMLGKAAVPLLASSLQLTVLFGLGGPVFDLRVRGPMVAIGLVAAALAVCLVALGFLLLAFCRTVMQLTTIANLGAVLLAGLGGAITPISSLPDWARHIAPALPSYWAMRGFRSVILDGAGVSAVLLPIAVLLAFAVAATIVANWRLDPTETKIGLT